MENLLVELSNVSYAYKNTYVLENVNLKIFSGDFIGVIGPNGGGKTTIVKLILELLKPTSGNINLQKQNINIGYLPQHNNIDKDFPLKVVDVVLSGLMIKKKLWRKYNNDDFEQANSALTKMGVPDLKNKHIGSLSGGQMQKVLMARAIVSNPDLLILDEPDTYVDYRSEGEMYELLKVLNKSMAIIIVSHDIGTISSYVKTIACVNKKLVYHNSNIISNEQLQSYNCPIKLITHGQVPHTVLRRHDL